MLTRQSTVLLLFTLLITSCGPNSKEVKNANNAQATESSLVGEELSYSGDSITMKGYLAYSDQTEKRPGILVIHEWWGHNEYVRKRADMLAEMGYVALAIDMYGDGKKAGHPEDAGAFAGQVFSNLEGAKARFEAALNELKSNPHVDTNHIAAIGYCFGGSVALCMANAGYDLDAVAAFHSGVELPIPPSEKLKARVLVANGADDPFIPMEQADSYKSAMDAIGANYEYISIPGAIHAYSSPDATALGEKFDLPLAYNKEADNLSWTKLNEMLNEVFN